MSDAGEKVYPKPSLTADTVVTAKVGEGRYRLLMIRRGREPFLGMWALPGGFVEPNETVGQAAVRELEEETRLKGVTAEELGCYSTPGRDPRGWIVTIAHVASVTEDQMKQASAGDDAADLAWLDLTVDERGGFTLSHEGQTVDRLAFDHIEMVEKAVRRLIGRG